MIRNDYTYKHIDSSDSSLFHICQMGRLVLFWALFLGLGIVSQKSLAYSIANNGDSNELVELVEVVDVVDVPASLDSTHSSIELESFEKSNEQNYPIQIRQFDTEQLDKYLNDSDFSYNRKVAPPNPSAWNMMMSYIRNLIREIFRIDGMDTVWDVLKYTFLIAFLLYGCSKLFGMSASNLFYNKKMTEKIDYQHIEENIHELNFNELIQLAIEERNYRKAVRLYYLKTLKILSDKEVIQWKVNKTNSDYKSEISNSTYAKDFSEISMLFDYVWYGEFPLDEPMFKNTQTKFQQFINSL